MIQKEIIIYQAKDGAIEFRGDFSGETVWGTQKQIAELFSVDVRTVNEHLKNIYKTNELEEKGTIRKFRIVQKEGKRKVGREVNFYNLDVIISVGYRVNSKYATQFRVWATKILKQHLIDGYSINKKRLKQNYQDFLKTVKNIKILAKNNQLIKNDDILELIRGFSSTWFNLESYDKDNLPQKGRKKARTKIDFQDFAQDLYKEIKIFKKELQRKKEATDFFAQEKRKESLEGILGNVLQSAFGKEMYETVEEKSVHLLYFIVKNHPFNDGNKRTGAFSFIWFLRKMKFDFVGKISPQTLTVLTLLIAESKPKDKEKMIGLVLLLLKK